MKCQKCGSERIAVMNAKCPDGFELMIGSDQYRLPVIPGLCEGEYIEPKVCLDCGQCQGEWPVKMTDEPFVPLPPPQFYKDAAKWLADCKEHAKHNPMMPADDPGYRAFGYACPKCEKWFGIQLVSAKASFDKLTEEECELLKTAHGRYKLRDSWVVSALRELGYPVEKVEVLGSTVGCQHSHSYPAKRYSWFRPAFGGEIMLVFDRDVSEEELAGIAKWLGAIPVEA